MSSPTVSVASDLVVVANRLPVRCVRRLARVTWERSPGGLVSALRPILRERPTTWVGWPGISDTLAPFEFEGIWNVPVAISAAEHKAYYEGFSNRVLWPLYHDNIRQPEFDRNTWTNYVGINKRFADVAAKVAAEGAIAWVHDYQLQLVPQMLRRLRPDLRIGFFLHIPFPPQELFAQLPWRKEILEGLLGSDIVGFQTQIGAMNFAQVCRRYAGAGSGEGEWVLEHEGRSVEIRSFPISIDFDQFNTMAVDDAVAERREEVRSWLGRSRKLLLGVDRLDYTKGIDTRLQAFRGLLASGRMDRDECVLVQVAVPSREHVAEYRQLRSRVEGMVGEINGEFGEIGHVPVQYLHRSVSPVELSALYTAADVMLVTPLRDGMNLVCKEYVASRRELTGALVLSEFTGAAKELTSALQVNPYDIDGVISTMETAIHMPLAEQTVRMEAMRETVRRQNVHAWASRFFSTLEHAHAG